MDKKATSLTEQDAPATGGAVVESAPADETTTTPADAPTGTGLTGDGGAATAEAEPEVPVEEDESSAAATEPPDETAVRLAELQAEKDALTRRVAELRDKLLREAADFDNYRKRVARQEQETQERARVDALRLFLPVIDNVERALGFAGQLSGGEPVAQGLQMVLRSFFDAFGSQGLKRIEALGKPFDPLTHEAVGQLETADTPAGCVAQELQAGYQLKERLLRPAMVVVAKPPAAPDAPPPETAPTAAEATGQPEPPPGGAEGA
jgi:molecular chaperone GrpE